MESSLGEYSSHPSAQWHNNSGKSQRFREEILPETSSMKHNNENHPGGLKSGLYCGTNLNDQNTATWKKNRRNRGRIVNQMHYISLYFNS